MLYVSRSAGAFAMSRLDSYQVVVLGSWVTVFQESYLPLMNITYIIVIITKCV